MVGSVFADRTSPPDDAALDRVLGRTRTHWDTILAHALKSGDVKPVWKYYGKKHGWQLKLMQKRRALLFLVPKDGSFLAGMALRESSLDGLRDARLPPALVTEIEAAKTYMEGRPARVEVRTRKDVTTLKRLLVLKRA